jgi:hypothetical protein
MSHVNMADQTKTCGIVIMALPPGQETPDPLAV